MPKTKKKNPKKSREKSPTKKIAQKGKPKKGGETKKKPISASPLTQEKSKQRTAASAGKDTILSVIIPAYKEEKRIGNTLLSIDKYLSPLGFPYEIIVVIDGSPDNTFQVVEGYRKMIKNLSIINNPENHGKGYVVRQGLLAAKGAYRLFMDADNSTTIDQIENFSPCFEDREVGIVIGSRDLAGSQIKRHQSWIKELAGNTGNILIQAVAGLWGIKDTQCGFKILTAEAAEIVCPLMRINRFGFDFEMLVLCKKVGFVIKEVPVTWINDEASTVTLGSYLNVFKELFSVRWNLWTGKYDLAGARDKKKTLLK